MLTWKLGIFDYSRVGLVTKEKYQATPLKKANYWNQGTFFQFPVTPLQKFLCQTKKKSVNRELKKNAFHYIPCFNSNESAKKYMKIIQMFNSREQKQLVKSWRLAASLTALNDPWQQHVTSSHCYWQQLKLERQQRYGDEEEGDRTTLTNALWPWISPVVVDALAAVTSTSVIATRALTIELRIWQNNTNVYQPFGQLKQDVDEQVGGYCPSSADSVVKTKTPSSERHFTPMWLVSWQLYVRMSRTYPQLQTRSVPRYLPCWKY
jgi:hypothetical protein